MNRKPVRTVLLLVGAVAAVGFGIAAGFWITGYWQAAVPKKPAPPPPADVVHPKALDRAGFVLQYPGNWSVDTEDPDYDADHNFTITSAGGSQIAFVLRDQPGDPQKTLDAFVDVQQHLMMKGPPPEPFTRWGEYEGRGAEMRGRVKDFLRGTVRIFVFSDDRRSFIIVSMMYDEDRAGVEPGLRLIESTFRLKP